MKRQSQLRLALLGIIVSILAVVFIVTQIDRQLFIRALQTARYEYLVLGFLLLLAGLVTRALRWQTLLNGDLPLIRAFSIMNVAYLVNGVLPLRIGEVARVYLAARVEKPVPMPRTASTIIVERLLDLLSVVVMLFLSLTVAPVIPELRAAGLSAAAMAIFGFVVLVIMSGRRSTVHRLTGAAISRVVFLERFPVEKWLDQFLDGLLPLTQPAALGRVMLWNCLSWGFSIAAGYIMMFAFFEDASLAATLLYIASASFAIALPAVPGNVGTYEASILLALTAMGYDQSSVSLAFAVMVHAVNMFVHIVTGGVGFIQEGISLGQLTRGVQRMQHNTSEAG